MSRYVCQRHDPARDNPWIFVNTFLTGEKSPDLCHLKDGVQGILDATWEPKPTTGMTTGSCMGSAAGQSAMGVVEGFFFRGMKSGVGTC
ncbi:hypothetical protein M404DRAFT_1006028 [Pisolithus tinctorius Marx 270]|uniref:Uncharacterized protein n=1 Tax=Pisolithus tinctorius Marx 270 TaxID=870435 RepID=A0A0C3IKM4_PISTI|nr:hypothetical protein M404DRAFT_1006028 [Pisolithus tinctorius Marx 270]